MADTVTVRIPRLLNYTLYAEGFLCGIERDGADFLVTLDFSFPVILYYTYRYHRRIYIISRPCPPCITKSRDVSREFSIISQLRGRSFDRFKRSVKYIADRTGRTCFGFPAAFFWQLSYLCIAGKNDRINLNLLIKKYSPRFSFEYTPEQNKLMERNVALFSKQVSYDRRINRSF